MATDLQVFIINGCHQNTEAAVPLLVEKSIATSRRRAGVLQAQDQTGEVG